MSWKAFLYDKDRLMIAWKYFYRFRTYNTSTLKHLNPERDYCVTGNAFSRSFSPFWWKKILCFHRGFF